MPLTQEARGAIGRAAAELEPGHRLLFVTGAGLSADSGMPTYRGVGGLYDRGPTEEGLPIEVILSGRMIRTRPDLTWKYLKEIGDACRGRTFNRGHEVIAEMEAHFAGVCVLTQNVDGFHRAAGSNDVIEIHGNLHRVLCPSCDWAAASETLDPDAIPPLCPRCEAVIRPDVVLFGEALPTAGLATLHDRMDRGFDMVFSVGTSSGFPYIAAPIYRARRSGVPTVEINPGTTDVSDRVDIKIEARAAEALDALWSEYQSRKASA